MHNWKTIWKNTIFRRLIITFLLILLPIYLIGVYIYNWGFHAINDDISKTMIAQVTFYMEKLEDEIKRIKFLQNVCMSDDNLNQLVFIPNTMNNFEKSQAALRLRDRLIAIKNSSNYIKDVKASIPEQGFILTANQGVTFTSDIKPDILSASYMSPKSQMLYWQGDFYLSNFYESTYRDRILYWLDISFSREIFNNDLKQFNTFNDSMSMLYNPSEEILLLNGATDLDEVLKDSLEKQLDHAKSGSYRITFNQKRYYGFYYTSDYLGLTLARYIPEAEVQSPVKSYQIWLWVYLAMSLVIIFLFSVSIYRFIHKPLNMLLESFKKVESGNLSINIEHRHNDEFRHLYHSFNKMTENLGTLIDQAYKQKILMQNAELKQMQAQINPHFLYNSFFILYSIAKAEDYDTVLMFLQELGNYFKYITRNAEDEVWLCKEVEHARTYANIQALRFSNRIAIQFDEVPEKFCHFPVPRLIIQPIIENSFKYGLENKASEGFLRISFAESDGFLQLIAEDNGSGMNSYELYALRETLYDKEHLTEATGIVNIHRRLQLKFGENSGLSVTNSELGGLKVIINIEISGGKHV